jgi:methionyl aminopeptidase
MIKQPQEVALMAEAGRLLTHVFERLDRTELTGMTTLQARPVG